MIQLILSCLWPLGACRQILALFLTFSWLKKKMFGLIVSLILLHIEVFFLVFCPTFKNDFTVTQRKQAAEHIWRALDYKKSSEILISPLSLGQLKAMKLPLECLQLWQPKKKTKHWLSLEQFRSILTQTLKI